MEHNELPLLVSISNENAAYLGITRSLMYRLAHMTDAGLSVQIGGRWFLKRDALLDWLGINENSG